MSEVTNSDLMGVLMSVREDLGGIKANVASTSALLANHIGVDTVVQAQLRTDVSTLQLGAARQKGFLAAIGTIGTMLGAGMGYMIDMMRHH
jgi:hypothetical protein